MRRHTLRMMMVLGVAGLGLSLSTSTGSALTLSNPSIHLAVGHSSVMKIGNGKVFVVQSCTSTNANVVPCQLPAAVPHAVQVWCLSATSSPIPVNVTFEALGSSNPVSSINLSVNCKAVAIPSIRVLASRSVSPLQAVTQFAVNSCTTNAVGATCTTQGSTLIESCSLAVTVNALPALVTASVIVDGAPAVNGKTMTLYFRCIA